MSESLIPALDAPTGERRMVAAPRRDGEDLAEFALRLGRLLLGGAAQGRTVVLDSAAMKEMCAAEIVLQRGAVRARRLPEWVLREPVVAAGQGPDVRPYFFLGTHHPINLSRTAVRLFVSHRRLRGRKSMPKALGPWAQDSGGFSELQEHGDWTVDPREYVEATARHQREIGRMEWAAPQDWMCEPIVISGGRVGRVVFAGTHLSVEEHLRRTVLNFLELVVLWPEYSDGPCPFVPVLQGYTLPQYMACWDLYEAHGVRLEDYPVTPVGSVCRRQRSEEIATVLSEIKQRGPGLRLHGFGVKTLGLARYAHLLHSADSMAWSEAAKHLPPLPGCVGRHKTCANCPVFALRWLARIEELIRSGPRQAGWMDHYEEEAA